MNILKSMAAQCKTVDYTGRPFDETWVDAISIADNRWPRMGVVLGNEALLVDYMTFSSFRVRSGNLGFCKKIALFKATNPPDKAYLKHYFFENQDNPYAVHNLMCRLCTGAPPEELTQFPPLASQHPSAEARTDAIKQLIAAAKKGDVVFSMQHNDGISALLRKHDKIQFSHSAPYVGGGQVVDVGPDGVTVNTVWDYGAKSQIALYRYRAPLTDDEREEMATKALQLVKRGNTYPYYKLFLLYLRKRFQLPVAKSYPSNGDLLYGGRLQLIAYA
jgi:hypothetical protein